ncbi:unnamed protein product [Gadus morhua 'NCC']
MLRSIGVGPRVPGGKMKVLVQEVRSPPRQEVRSPPRQEVRSPPRQGVRSPPRQEVRSPPRQEVRSPPRQEVRSPPRQEVRSPPRQEVRSPPRQEVRPPPARQEMRPPPARQEMRPAPLREHRAAIATEFKSLFVSMDAKLDKIQAVVSGQGKARAEDDRNRDKGRGTPAAAEDSEASLPDTDGQPVDIAVSPQRERSAPSEKPEHRKAVTPETKAASSFDTEYRAGTQSKPS